MANHTSEAELRALLGQGLTVPQIAEKLGMKEARIQIACSALGLLRDKRRIAPEQPDAFLADLKAGMTLSEIAVKHKKNTVTAVYQTLRRAGYPTTLRELIRREQQTV